MDRSHRNNMTHQDDEWSALGLTDDDDDEGSPRFGTLPRALFGRLDSGLDSHLVGGWGTAADTITPTMTSMSGYEYDNDASILSLSGTEDFSFDQVGVRYEFVQLLDRDIGNGNGRDDDDDDDLTSPSWPDDEELTLTSRSVFITDKSALSRPAASEAKVEVDEEGTEPRHVASTSTTNEETMQPDHSTPEPQRKKEIDWEPPRKSGSKRRPRSNLFRCLVGRRHRRQKEKLRLPAFIIINDYIYSLK
jgi:hypothetical protein